MSLDANHIKKYTSDLFGHFVSTMAYKINRALGRCTRPYFFLLGFTYRCNCRCKMCNIWQHKAPQELSLEEYSKIFADRRYWSKTKVISITGGEPILRKDIKELLLLLNEKFDHLKHVTLITNGLSPKPLEDLLSNLSNLKFKIHVLLSVHGLAEVCDKIVGINGAFDKIQKTLIFLSDFTNVSSGKVSFSTNTVIQEDNYFNINSLVSYFKDMGIKYDFTMLMDADYFNLNSGKQKFINNEDIFEKTKSFYEPMKFNWYFYHYSNFLHTNKKKQACNSGWSDFFLDPTGQVYPCNYLDISMGNVSDHGYSVQDVLKLENARNVLSCLPNYPYCKKCIQNCSYPSVLHYNFFSILRDRVACYTKNNKYFQSWISSDR